MDGSCIYHAKAMEPLLRRLREGTPTSLVALGDSNTCNHLFTRTEKGWPELLQMYLRITYDCQPITLINSGICGDTTTLAIERLERDVIRYTPHCTIVTLGTNDAGRLTANEFEKNLATIVDMVSAAGSLVVLRTITPVMERMPSPPHIWKNDRARRENVERSVALAHRRALPCVDVHRAWMDMEEKGALAIGELMFDEVHPNAAGHRLVLHQLAPLFGIDCAGLPPVHPVTPS